MTRDDDRAARRAAQTEFAAPLVLEAGAGTGKTTTLVARVLAWTLGPGWERARERLAAARASTTPATPAEPEADEAIAAAVLGRVVAITFTEAAAAEMAGRVARELAVVAQAGALPEWLEPDGLPAAGERARRARALLATLDRLAVRTIHAFCRGLLAAHPLEAGLHPGLTVDADGRVLAEVVREVVEARLREAYGEPGDPHLLALAAAGHGPQEIVEALIVLAREGLPAAVLADDPLAPARVGALHRRLAEAASALHALISHRLAGAARSKNALGIERGLAALSSRLWGPSARPPELAVLRAWVAEALPPNLLAHLKNWKTGHLNQTEARCLAEVRGELAAHAGALHGLVEHLARLDPGLLDHARLALAPLLAAVERELKARGVATFNALLSEAAALLAGNPEVRGRVRRGIDQLLVDEFQDTDRLQCALLASLAFDGPREERPGLFLVGDPKQSIYGWRSADLAAYDGFVARVRAEGGDVRTLAANFRSAPAILAEVARVIAPVMRGQAGLQPRFEPLLPVRADSPGFAHGGEAPRRPVEHWVSWREEDGARPALARTRSVDAAELEATAIARDVLELHSAHGVAWRQVGLLLRSTGDLDVYLEALRRAGIPFLVGRDKQYYRRREVIEAAALVRAVLDPGDHLALLTVLRSAMVGVPDAALEPLWNRDLPRLVTELAAPRSEPLAAVRAAALEAAREVAARDGDVPGLDQVRGWELGLLAAVEHLAVLRQDFESRPADAFVERLRRLFLPEAIESARYLGPYRLANLERFFRQLLTAMEEGGGDVNAILRVLRTSVAEAQEAEEGRPREGAEDAVSVLTIHGAKGLEFDHVYLAQLHKRSAGDRRPPVEVGRLAGADGHGFEVRLFGAPTLAFDLVEAERAAVESAERVRTLYVAMTRARERLVLMGVWPEPATPRSPEQAKTHQELLLSRPDRPRESAAELWRESIERRTWLLEDPAGAIWKLPALDPRRSAAPETAAAGAVELPAVEEIARAGAELAARRAVATARMARPFSGAASEEAHELLRELLAERGFGEERPGERGRESALAVGGAVHRALETWDLAADPEEELARQQRLLPAYLAAVADPEADAGGEALERAGALLDRLAAGRLMVRLRAIGTHVLARELPVLVPPADPERGPVGVVSGAIDLLYRDPGSGEVVIVDYKTDDVESPEELAARATAYAPQGAVYARAIREALSLAKPPRFELWFLRADRVVAVPVPAP